MPQVESLYRLTQVLRVGGGGCIITECTSCFQSLTDLFTVTGSGYPRRAKVRIRSVTFWRKFTLGCGGDTKCVRFRLQR